MIELSKGVQNFLITLETNDRIHTFTSTIFQAGHIINLCTWNNLLLLECMDPVQEDVQLQLLCGCCPCPCTHAHLEMREPFYEISLHIQLVSETLCKTALMIYSSNIIVVSISHLFLLCALYCTLSWSPTHAFHISNHKAQHKQACGHCLLYQKYLCIQISL